MADRLSCCVPHCRRTRKNPDGYKAWICGKHWQLVPKHLRRRDRKLVRRYVRRFGRNPFWHFPGGSPERIEAVRLTRLCEKSWEACKKKAIEGAAGI